VSYFSFPYVITAFNNEALLYHLCIDLVDYCVLMVFVEMANVIVTNILNIFQKWDMKPKMSCATDIIGKNNLVEVLNTNITNIGDILNSFKYS